MKLTQVAKDFGLDYNDLEVWLKNNRSTFPTEVNFNGTRILDKNVDVTSMVKAFSEHETNQVKEKALQHAENERLLAERNHEMSKMLITSGFTFDGYRITKYSGYISGDDAVSLNRPSEKFWGGVDGDVGSDLLSSLSQLRRNALAELKMAAYDLGCNAVIGVDFDYISLDPETASSTGGTILLPFLFAVTANGNAVVIEKA